jgi:hypothetical protein
MYSGRADVFVEYYSYAEERGGGMLLDKFTKSGG